MECPIKYRCKKRDNDPLAPMQETCIANTFENQYHLSYRGDIFSPNSDTLQRYFEQLTNALIRSEVSEWVVF